MKQSRARWVVVALLFLASVNNYLDRQALSVLAPILRADLGLSAVDYSFIVNAFLVSYAVMYAGSGRLMDLFGPRRGIAVCMLAWSVVASLHGLAGGLLTLMMLRFLLGLAEPGLYPGAIRMISGLFSARGRGLPIGIVVSGASVGAMLAPPVVLWLANRYDWRMAFLVTGASGLLIWIAWISLLRRWLPEESSAQVARDPLAPQESTLPWRSLLRSPAVRAYMLTRALGDPAWYYVIFWLPDYLVRERGFTLDAIGRIGWVPFAGLDAGVIAGGLAAAALIRRGVAEAWSRIAVAGVAVILFLAGLLGSLLVDAPLGVVLLIGVAVLAIGLWMATIYAIPGDVLPLSSTASVVGLGGSAGSVGGMVFAAATGVLADAGLYWVAFAATPLMFTLSVIVLAVGVGRQQPRSTVS